MSDRIERRTQRLKQFQNVHRFETLEEYIERSVFVTRVRGDGTVTRDAERVLEGMDEVAKFVFANASLSGAEERAIVEFLEDRGVMLNGYCEELPTETESLLDFED